LTAEQLSALGSHCIILTPTLFGSDGIICTIKITNNAGSQTEYNAAKHDIFNRDYGHPTSPFPRSTPS
jgi:hypothetical protein